MSTTKDCGDLTVSVAIRTGVKFGAAAVTDEEKLARMAIDEKIADILPQLEKTLLEQVCDHIGYDAETVTAKVKAREDKNAADRKAEDEGRAEKKRRRDGMPPLQAPPPIEQGLAKTETDEPDERED